MMLFISHRLYGLLFGIITIVYLAGLTVDVMNVDAAQYAAMSREMYESGSYFQVQLHGEKYLDKPPLLFWLSALSFKIFGVSDWSYKLPSFLFTLLSLLAVYRLGSLLYDKRVGALAALILYTCQAYFLFNHDVRTDTLLAACVITSIWLIYEFYKKGKWYYCTGAAVFIALGMMAKGPIALMIPILALGSHFALKRKWMFFLRKEWLYGLGIVFILLLPMCWGLYAQHGWEGIKFFFWTQSFGRITGENVWRNDTGPFYFTHTFVWAFMPWTFIALYALSDYFITFVRRKTLPEYITLAGFLLPFVALSLSKYKLPHYIFVLFPLLAILTAEVIISQITSQRKISRFFRYLQLLFIGVAFLISGLLFFIVFPYQNIWFVNTVIAVLLLSAYFYYLRIIDGIVIPSVLAAFALNFTLNIHFYPQLLKYQGGKQAAVLLKEENVNNDKVYFFERNSYAFEFYLQDCPKPVYRENILKKMKDGENFWVYSEADLPSALNEIGVKPEKFYSFENYKVQFLKIEFLNPKTRDEVLSKVYLVKI